MNVGLWVFVALLGLLVVGLPIGLTLAHWFGDSIMCSIEARRSRTEYARTLRQAEGVARARAAADDAFFAREAELLTDSVEQYLRRIAESS